MNEEIQFKSFAESKKKKKDVVVFCFLYLSGMNMNLFVAHQSYQQFTSKKKKYHLTFKRAQKVHSIPLFFFDFFISFTEESFSCSHSVGQLILQVFLSFFLLISSHKKQKEGEVRVVDRYRAREAILSL